MVKYAPTYVCDIVLRIALLCHHKISDKRFGTFTPSSVIDLNMVWPAGVGGTVGHTRAAAHKAVLVEAAGDTRAPSAPKSD